MGMFWRRFNVAQRVAGDGLLPLLPTARAMFVGDSRTAYGKYTTSATTGSTEANGYSINMLSFLGGRVEHTPDTENFGYSGKTTSFLLEPTQWNAIAACPAQLAVVLIGVNNWGATIVPIDQTIAEGKEILRRLKALGKQVIWITEPPRFKGTYNGNAIDGWSGLSDADIATRLPLRLQYNAAMLDYCRSNGIGVADIRDDLTGADGQADPRLLGDGLHPSDYGALIIGKRAASVAKPIVTAPLLDLVTTAGNLIGNNILDGTTGSKAANVGGVVATGYTAGRVGGTISAGNITAYKEVRAEGGFWQGVKYDGVVTDNASEGINLFRTVDTAGVGLVAGDSVRVRAWARLTNPSQFRGGQIRVQERDGSTTINTFTAKRVAADNTRLFTAGFEPVVWETEPFLIRPIADTGARNLTVFLDGYVNPLSGACNADFALGPIRVEKVA